MVNIGYHNFSPTLFSTAKIGKFVIKIESD